MSDQASAPRVRLIQLLADMIESRRVVHPLRVAIDGPDAAGKTTLADEIAGVLAGRGRHAIRASIDGFHRSRSDRYRRGADSPDGYYEDSFDCEALRRVLLAPLGPGGDGRYRARVFDYLTDRPQSAPLLVAGDDAVLVFDGVFLLRPELSDAWDFRIFVAAGFDETLRRAVVRDASLFGSPHEVERRYRMRYIPGQQLYFATAHPEEVADVVVDNNDPTRPVLREEPRW